MHRLGLSQLEPCLPADALRLVPQGSSCYLADRHTVDFLDRSVLNTEHGKGKVCPRLSQAFEQLIEPADSLFNLLLNCYNVHANTPLSPRLCCCIFSRESSLADHPRLVRAWTEWEEQQKAFGPSR